MASIGGKYDNSADPSTGFDVMPEHDCAAQIVESDVKKTIAGTGEYIALTVMLLDGPHKGRKLWANMNIRNPSEKAQQIGNAEFAAVRVALFGTKDRAVNDTVELHNIPCRIKVGCRKRKDNDEMENYIKKWTSLKDAPAVATGNNPSTGRPW